MSPKLEKILRKKYDPRATVSFRFSGNDIALKTDDNGNAVLMFIGALNDSGKIKGERYTRVLKKDREGHIIKDHWERKGKV